jgi:hypothetical protein
MKALATGVQTECALTLSRSNVGYMDVQAYVWIGNAYIRALTHFLAELVYDGILHLVSHELRVTELIRKYYRVHGKCLIQVQIFGPVYGFYSFVNVVGRQCLEVLDGF